MGSINHYFCNHCDEDQIAYYGIGMMYPINKIDIRVFGCYDCGIVYNGNINKDSLCCPKCKKEALELNFHNENESTSVQCPSCKTGQLILENIGNWD
jgi:predicted Zn-ribbon and HTH transcriptional regulator